MNNPQDGAETKLAIARFTGVALLLAGAMAGALVKWSFDPKPAASAQGVACCDYVNPGAAFADGRLFFNTLDGQTIAVDAETGDELWRAQLGDINKGESMAPLVVKGKALWAEPDGLPVDCRLRLDQRELLLTSVVDADPEVRDPSPEPSIWPLLSAPAVTVLFICSIFTPLGVAVV